MIANYYYGFLVYSDLCCHRSFPLAFNEQLIKAFTKVTFQMWANHLFEKILDGDIAEQDVCAETALSVSCTTPTMMGIFLWTSSRNWSV